MAATPPLGGWGQVDVQDDFFVGLEEGGFMGLEVLSEPRMESKAGGSSLTPATAPESSGGKEPKKKTKKQAEAEAAPSGKHKEATVSSRDDTSEGAAVAPVEMPSQKKKKRNNGMAVPAVKYAFPEQQLAASRIEAAGQAPNAKPPRKRKRRGEEHAAAADADGDSGHDGGSAGDGGSPADPAEAVLQRRAEKVAAMAERLTGVQGGDGGTPKTRQGGGSGGECRNHPEHKRLIDALPSATP